MGDSGSEYRDRSGQPVREGAKVLDDRDLVIETEGVEEFQNLQKALAETFGGEVDAEVVPKKDQRC